MERQWIKKVNFNNLEIYPIQFANVERINNNDRVFLFDEVGTGKTISAGMMAIEFLEKNPNKNVLVITTNSLVPRDEFNNGQFLQDWYDKLPFDPLGLIDRITVVNNHFINIRKQEGKDWGMIIIDEAHLFINESSLRYNSLLNLHADKVVIMTASPIKNHWSNLFIYETIASNIINKIPDSTWIEKLKCNGKHEKDIVCATFDVKSPITRYFKDTVTAVNQDGLIEKKAKRLTPEIWEYDDKIGKDEVLLNGMMDSLKVNHKSRFVIFTRYVEKEAYHLKRYFSEHNFKEYTINSQSKEESSDYTYYVVTGENREELSYFSKVSSNMPTVLILTYQIAEQGINLPSFNYVINYHISAFPSALEQRFGRIDRMGKNGSVYDEINMRFLISKDRWDVSTANFYQAVSTYMGSMISYLPSKNTLLTKEIVDRYVEKSKRIYEYVEKIRRLCTDNKLEEVINYYNNDINLELELVDFIESNEISDEIDFSIEEHDIEQLKTTLKKKILNKLNELVSNFSNDSNIDFLEMDKFLESVNDKIFYSYNIKWEMIDTIKCTFNLDYDIRTINPIDAASYILDEPLYSPYFNHFKKEIKIPLIFNKYRYDLEKIFEYVFLANTGSLNKTCFEILFSPEYNLNIPIEKVWKTEKEQNDYELIKDELNSLIPTLPFFYMCKKFERIIKHEVSVVQTGEWKGYWLDRFDFNPFTSALYKILFFCKNFSQDDFVYLHKLEFGKLQPNAYKLEIVDGEVKASNWLKLFFKSCKYNDNDPYELFKHIYYIKSKKETRTYIPYDFHEYKYRSLGIKYDEEITRMIVKELL